MTSRSIIPCGRGNQPSSQSGGSTECPRLSSVPRCLRPPARSGPRRTLNTHRGCDVLLESLQSTVRAAKNRPRCGAARCLIRQLTTRSCRSCPQVTPRTVRATGSCGASVRGGGGSLRPDGKAPMTDGDCAARQGCVTLGTSSLVGLRFDGSRAPMRVLGDSGREFEWVTVEARRPQVTARFRCGQNQLPHLRLTFQRSGGWLPLVMVRGLDGWNIKAWCLSVGGFDL